LAAAINSAITGFTSTSAAGEAFKNAEIRAVINTDTTGKQQLAFTSSTAAFQVKAGDRLANALLGNFDSGGPAGASLDVTRTGAVSAATAAAADVISVVLNGGGLLSPQMVSYTATIGDDQATVVAGLQAAIAANTTLAGAGFSVTEAGGQASFTNGNGESFQVRVVGDASNVLGFGAAELGDSAEARYNTVTTASPHRRRAPRRISRSCSKAPRRRRPSASRSPRRQRFRTRSTRSTPPSPTMPRCPEPA
jgi:hypothetical protein